MAERFLFEPRPEGFIIFHGRLQIPNFDGTLSPQHGLISFNTPYHPSLPILSTAAPHHPTRRPAIGTLVTLSSQGCNRGEATVVAIEQNHWPWEWIYMVRRQDSGKSPELLTAILDRGILNSQDISTHICPKAVILKNGEVAFFFNEFERPIQVTITQESSPSFYETVRMVQPLQTELYPMMKIQDIESHRLFTADMSLSYMANPSEETQPALELTSMIQWEPKIAWNLIRDKAIDTDYTPYSAWQTATESNLHFGMPHLEAPTAPAEGKRKAIANERHTVVIPKKRWFRGAQPQKILIRWRHFIIPCTFSDHLTPATLIEDIGNSDRVSPAAMTKATLVHPNDPLVTLFLYTPLSMQGIVTGDTLTLLV